MTVEPTAQLELGARLFEVVPESPNVDWLVTWLDGRDWITAAEVLRCIGREVTENEKRKIRAWADASAGRVCGHQKGYKLTKSMTNEEYGWWRNEILKMADALRGRVIESDRVFYKKRGAGSTEQGDGIE